MRPTPMVAQRTLRPSKREGRRSPVRGLAVTGVGSGGAVPRTRGTWVIHFAITSLMALVRSSLLVRPTNFFRTSPPLKMMIVGIASMP